MSVYQRMSCVCVCGGGGGSVCVCVCVCVTTVSLRGHGQPRSTGPTSLPPNAAAAACPANAQHRVGNQP